MEPAANWGPKGIAVSHIPARLLPGRRCPGRLRELPRFVSNQLSLVRAAVGGEQLQARTAPIRRHPRGAGAGKELSAGHGPGPCTRWQRGGCRACGRVLAWFHGIGAALPRAGPLGLAQLFPALLPGRIHHARARPPGCPRAWHCPFVSAKGKYISVSSHASSAGNNQIKIEPPPVPLCHHPPSAGGADPAPAPAPLGGAQPPEAAPQGKSSWDCTVGETKAALCQYQETCWGHRAQPQQLLLHGAEPQAALAPPGGWTSRQVWSTSQRGHAQPVQRLLESISAACVMLAAIKRFKLQFLTFMNKWPWLDDSGSIQFPARKCQQKLSLSRVGG